MVRASTSLRFKAFGQVEIKQSLLIYGGVLPSFGGKSGRITYGMSYLVWCEEDRVAPNA